MSWLFSRALVEEYSLAKNSDGEPSAPLSGCNIPRAYLSPDKMKDFSRLSRFGMTFGPLTDDLGEELLTWFREDFLAKTFQQPEAVPESKVSEAACGQKWLGLLARYDRDTFTWRTAQRSLLADSDEFSETWPRWGTTVAGELYLLPMSVRPMKESVSGLWPTPTCHNSKEGGYPAEFTRKTPTLAAQVLMGGPAKKWPTPCASDDRDRGNMSLPSIQRRAALGKQVMLSMAVKPDSQTIGTLSPTWTEWLMGWPLGWTDLKPLVTGKSPSAQPLPGES